LAVKVGHETSQLTLLSGPSLKLKVNEQSIVLNEQQELTVNN
jgi:muramoyltetrapeptide carboxypeptidase LdcA involved in peptidoglycan recycling